MSRLSRQETAVVLGLLFALLAIAHYLGWIGSAPPLLAPGIH